jgi:hypothetical protein
LIIAQLSATVPPLAGIKALTKTKHTGIIIKINVINIKGSNRKNFFSNFALELLNFEFIWVPFLFLGHDMNFFSKPI